MFLHTDFRLYVLALAAVSARYVETRCNLLESTGSGCQKLLSIFIHYLGVCPLAAAATTLQPAHPAALLFATYTRCQVPCC
jgi:hypothetical protein